MPSVSSANGEDIEASKATLEVKRDDTEDLNKEKQELKGMTSFYYDYYLQKNLFSLKKKCLPFFILLKFWLKKNYIQGRRIRLTIYRGCLFILSLEEEETDHYSKLQSPQEDIYSEAFYCDTSDFKKTGKLLVYVAALRHNCWSVM